MKKKNQWIIMIICLGIGLRFAIISLLRIPSCIEIIESYSSEGTLLFQKLFLIESSLFLFWLIGAILYAVNRIRVLENKKPKIVYKLIALLGIAIWIYTELPIHKCYVGVHHSLWETCCHFH